VGIARLLRGVLPGNVGAMVRAINGTTALLCDDLDDITEDDLAPVPFEGGQCPGDLYSVTVTGTFAEGSPYNFTAECSGLPSFQVRGPVRGVGFSESPTSPPTWSVFINHGGPLSPRQIAGGGFVSDGEPSVSISSVTRCAGGPDNCGDPPREFPDPLEPLPLPPINFTFENNEGLTVNATANITLSPAISIGGEISFPVDIEIGDLAFNGFFNLDGSLTFSPTVNINPPGAPPSAGPPLPGDEPPAPEETGSVLIGVSVSVQSPGSVVSQRESIGAPVLLIPRAASVNFLIETEDGNFWSSDFDAKNGDCFVPAPPGVTAIDAAVTPYGGVVLTWRRVYAEQRVPVIN